MSAPKRRRDVDWDDYYNVPRQPLIPVKFNIPRRQSSSSSASSASVPKNKNPLIDFITRPAPPLRRPSTPSPSPSPSPLADAAKSRRVLSDHLCVSCAQPGHQADFCPSLVCPHCGERKPRHDAFACPAWRKCRRCRKRGHDEPDCTGARARPGLTEGDECDVCGELGHVEEECGGLWCTVPPKVARDRMQVGEKREVDAGIRSCVYCASDEHWGDQCSEKDRAGRDVPGTWKRREMVEKEEAAQGEEELPPARNWQRAMFDDFADF